MIKNNKDNVFALINEIESHKYLTSPDNQRGSILSSVDPSIMGEEEYFRSSSIEYFRNSSINGMIISRSESEEKEEQKSNTKELLSKGNFNDKDFMILSTVGTGAYAKVYKAKNLQTNELCAMKIIEKKLMEKEDKAYQIYVENEILNSLTHPNIINILGAFQEDDKINLILELCPKGDLGEYIILNSPLDLNVAKFFIAQMILAIEYLNSMGIVHRDIKPDNFLIDKNFHLKLVN